MSRRQRKQSEVGINWSVTGLKMAESSDGEGGNEDMDLNDWTEVQRNKRVRRR